MLPPPGCFNFLIERNDDHLSWSLSVTREYGGLGTISSGLWVFGPVESFLIWHGPYMLMYLDAYICVIKKASTPILLIFITMIREAEWQVRWWHTAEILAFWRLILEVYDFDSEPHSETMLQNMMKRSKRRTYLLRACWAQELWWGLALCP